jgi:hypothetical protein
MAQTIATVKNPKSEIRRNKTTDEHRKTPIKQGMGNFTSRGSDSGLARARFLALTLTYLCSSVSICGKLFLSLRSEQNEAMLLPGWTRLPLSFGA